MASTKADDSATVVNASGRIVRNFSYEEIRRLVGKPGKTRELNGFVRLNVHLSYRILNEDEI